MSAECDRARGHAAEQLLRNRLLQEAFEEVERRYTEAWKKARTPEARERLHLAVDNLAKVKAHLASVVGSGRLAEQQIREIERGARRGIWAR